MNTFTDPKLCAPPITIDLPSMALLGRTISAALAPLPKLYTWAFRLRSRNHRINVLTKLHFLLPLRCHSACLSLTFPAYESNWKVLLPILLQIQLHGSLGPKCALEKPRRRWRVKINIRVIGTAGSPEIVATPRNMYYRGPGSVLVSAEQHSLGN